MEKNRQFDVCNSSWWFRNRNREFNYPSNYCQVPPPTFLFAIFICRIDFILKWLPTSLQSAIFHRSHNKSINCCTWSLKKAKQLIQFRFNAIFRFGFPLAPFSYGSKVDKIVYECSVKTSRLHSVSAISQGGFSTRFITPNRCYRNFYVPFLLNQQRLNTAIAHNKWINCLPTIIKSK